MGDIETGLSAWRMASNHNRMIELQRAPPVAGPGQVELAYFGSSAFRITSPGGITVMVDPWRNFPTRKWDWYFHDFPMTEVDIGVSTHAHFDHDALHRLDAHVLLDRLIGTYGFGDVKITGIADKHATDSSSAVYDFKKIIRQFDGIDITPPNNPRSWDHCLILIETGGLRILAWGDNRHNPPDEIWRALGAIDILLLPVDDSQHVMGFHQAQSVIDTLRPKVVVPHHYYIFDVTVRQSTLQPADPWVTRQGENARWLDSPTASYTTENIADLDARVDFFGGHVAFDKAKWLKDGA
jgi:L-ascorbate metabolism protein UlaG (beta-lactamase superfamily)